MPMGGPAAGYVAFCAVKAVGYTGAAAVISHIYSRSVRNAFVVGAKRTVIGMAGGAGMYAIGMAVGAGIYALQQIEDAQGIDIFGTMPKAIAGVTVLRFAEWWLWAFYDRHLSSRRGWGVACRGVVWSFILDIPAVFGFIIAARV